MLDLPHYLVSGKVVEFYTACGLIGPTDHVVSFLFCYYDAVW